MARATNAAAQRRAFALLAVAAIVLAFVSHSATHAAGTVTPAASEGVTASGLGPPPRWPDGQLAVPALHFEPQGAFGQFVAKCLYSHSASDDPIVSPGQRGRSHRHDFYGAFGTNGDSTAATLAARGSTCDKSGDDAAYWQPTLYDHHVAVVPLEAHAYYRAAPAVDPRQVAPFPFGMVLIAGDPAATSPQAGDAAGWTCGVRTHLSPTPPDCARTAPLRLVLTFPDCWDGVHVDTPGHRDQATYSEQGACPPTHPVHIPQLTLSIKFPVSGTGHALSLASGSIFSAHGDFLNVWDPTALRREIDHCIHNNVVCDVATNREDIPPFFTQ